MAATVNPYARLATGALGALTAVGLLAGCESMGASAPVTSPKVQEVTTPTATTAATEDLVQKTVVSKTSDSSPPKFVLVTPFTVFHGARVGDQPTEPDEKAVSGFGGDFADAYTRLVLTSDIPLPKDTDESGGSATTIDTLHYEPRQWLARYFFGREFSINLTSQVSSGSFTATVPLISLDHKSNRSDGELWTRTVYHSAANYPLFRVGSDGRGSIPTFKIELKGALAGQSNGAGSALGIVLGVTQDIAPGSAFVTALSKDQLKTQATAIDSAISKLYQKGIDESHISDADLRYWNPSEGVQVELRIPNSENNFNDIGDRRVGVWVLSFEAPHASIFVDWRICAFVAAASAAPRCLPDRKTAVAAVYRDVDAADVLNAKLVSGPNGLGQLGTWFSQQDWYKSGVVVLAKKIGDPTKTDGAISQADFDTAATNFCIHINSAASALELNTVDAKIAVWAVATAMPDLPNRAGITANAECAKSISEVAAARK